jgi:DNA adenine methylase
MISYIGGKYRMAKWISAYVPKNIKTYGEIFGGAFWVYLNSDIFKNENIKNVYYNDFNRMMVNMFSCCTNHKEFFEKIKNVSSQDEKLFNEFKELVLNMETNDEFKNIKIPDYELGYKYPYLLTQVFSGTGIKKSTKMIDLKGKYVSKFDVFKKRLQNPEFTNKLDKITDCLNLDFEKAVEKLDSKETFLYFDPPYYKTENYYSFHEFGKEDHLRLANVLKSMKGLWALSYYDFKELSEWFPKDKYIWIEKEFAKAASAKKGVGQKMGMEVLVMNYTIDEKTGMAKKII